MNGTNNLNSENNEVKPLTKKYPCFILNFSEIINYLKGPDPFKILKGLIILKKVLLLETNQEKSKLIFNDVNLLYNICEKYPEEFKYKFA